nr:putative disease resistance protein RGA3 [Ziziphus jujuba var. spinosa]
MHDCIHDLSISVTGTKGLILSSNDEKTDERTRHVSFNFTVNSLQHQALLVKTKRIRTIFVLNGYESSSRTLEKSILKCRFLRTLDLHDAGLWIIPKSLGIDSLNSLIIRKCAILLEKCRDDIGDYWPLIAHIKDLVLSPVTEEAEFSEEGVVLEESIPENSDSFFYHLSKLRTLHIDGIKDLQHLPDGLKRLTSLEKLEIEKCSMLQSLSPGLHHLISLQHLQIRDCEELEMPNDDGSDAILWQHLQSLSVLCLIKLPKLVALPQGLQHLTTLQEITIYGCENLESVLGNISNLKLLKKLDIRNCPNLKLLPEGIDCLASLEILEIEGCPILLERCQENMGDYWPMISHIKQIKLSAVTKELLNCYYIAEQQHEPKQQEESTSSKTCGLFNAKIFKH